MLNKGGSLTITHCTVRNFKDTGIDIRPTGKTAFLIADTAVSNNLSGIFVDPQGSGSAQGTLDQVSAHKNDFGIGVKGPATVLAVASTAANKGSSGFDVSTAAILWLAHSAATGNAVGVFVAGATAESAGDNFINGNTTAGSITDVVGGPLTKFATQ